MAGPGPVPIPVRSVLVGVSSPGRRRQMKRPARGSGPCQSGHLLAAVTGRQQQSGPAGGAEHQQPSLQHPFRIRLFSSLPEPYPFRLHRAHLILSCARLLRRLSCLARQAAHLWTSATRRQSPADNNSGQALAGPARWLGGRSTIAKSGVTRPPCQGYDEPTISYPQGDPR